MYDDVYKGPNIYEGRPRAEHVSRMLNNNLTHVLEVSKAHA